MPQRNYFGRLSLCSVNQKLVFQQGALGSVPSMHGCKQEGQVSRPLKASQ